MKKSTKRIIQGVVLSIGLIASLATFAEPSSNVAWDSATRNIIKNADIKKGKEAAKVCNSCHGVSGEEEMEGNFPSLAGQRAEYHYKQMMDYRDNKRNHGIMQNFATTLDKQTIANLAVWYASQKLPLATVEKATPASIRLAIRGDGTRLIPPCAGCHGAKGEGSIVDIPALAGMNPNYFVTIMQQFKVGTRANDIYNRMRLISAALTDQEIEELADYYASIGTPDAE